MTLAYFDADIDYQQNESLPKFEKLVASLAIDARKRASLRYSIYKKHLHLLLSRYSRGDDIHELATGFPAMLDALSLYENEKQNSEMAFDHPDEYQTALWLLSLALLLKRPEHECQRLLKLVGHRGEDAILDLFARALPGPVAPLPETKNSLPDPALLYPALFQKLLTAVRAVEKEAHKELKAYLKSWYGKRTDMYWHDNHKGPDGGGFFGYWALEVAAVVVVLGLDDRELQDSSYYPGDFVKFYRQG